MTTNSERPDDMMIVRFNNHVHLRLGEWLASLILASIGFILFAFPNIFEGEQTATYTYLRSICPQVVWAFGIGIVGVTRLVALYINGRRSITPYIRMAMAFVSCFLWYQFALGFVLSGVATTGLAVYPWLLVLDIYNVFRSSADAREVYDNKRASRDGTFEAK
jgi:hypothetical protein